MKNLFLKFISESSNFNQERISFINSVRKNSNLRPFSLINEAPAPAPQIAPGPGGGGGMSPDDFNKYIDDTFGRGLADIQRIPPDVTQNGFFMFDSLARDLLGEAYNVLPPSFITYLFQTMGGDLDALRNFINTIDNVSHTTQSGNQISGGIVFQKFILDLATLNWISSNLSNLNDLNSSPQLQQLLQNNPGFHANVLSMIQTIQSQNGLNSIFNYATIYMNIFQSFMQQGIVFPPSVFQLFERWSTSLTDITFNITNPGLSATTGMISPQNLPNTTAVTNSLQLPNNPAIWNIFQIIQNSYDNPGGPMNLMQLQAAANQMGISPELLSNLLIYTNGLPQNEFDAMMANILQAQQTGNYSGIAQSIMAAALQSPSNARDYEAILQTILAIWRRL